NGDGKANGGWSTAATRPGGAGVAGTSQLGNKYSSSAIHISGYRLTGGFADQLIVANVVSGFTLGPSADQSCNLGVTNALRLEPQVSISGVTVSNCSLSQTRVAPSTGVAITGLLYVNDTFN